MIRYGTYTSPFGLCFLALKGADICHVAFIEKKEEKRQVNLFQKQWPEDECVRDVTKIAKVAQRIFSDKKEVFSVIVEGTDFQMKVWQALLDIPYGEVRTYGEVARTVGSPRAVRAVGTACGMNPVAYLIPCHRVLPAGGGLGGYRWGIERKKALLAEEVGA